jgi:O-antigen/teichoic acid export membrane protein
MKLLKNNKSEVRNLTLLSAALRVLGSILAFYGSILVARLLGPEGTGQYFLLTSIIVTASVIGRAGVDLSLLKYISYEFALRNMTKCQKYFSTGVLRAMFFSSFAVLSIYLASGRLAIIFFDDVDMRHLFHWAAPAVYLYSFWMLCGEALKAVKKSLSLFCISSIGNPVIFILLVLWLVPTGGVFGVMISFFISLAVTSALCYLVWMGTVRVPHSVLGKDDRSALSRSGNLLFIFSIVNEAILPWGPIVFLGLWENSFGIGYFGAATRISVFMFSFLMMSNTIITPYLSETYAAEDPEAAIVACRKSSFLLVVLTLPVFVIIYVFPKEIMSAFGDGFDEGSSALMILLAGRFIQVLSGPATVLLLVAGKEFEVKLLSVFGASVLLLLLIILVPLIGIIGAAIAGAAGVAASSIGATVLVYRNLGQVVYPKW